MSAEIYIDLEILATDPEEETYLVTVSKKTLNSLVSFDEALVIRHWDGEKPVILEAYGTNAVRTSEDASTANNLSELPSIDADTFINWFRTNGHEEDLT